jgi:hypothetical protein
LHPQAYYGDDDRRTSTEDDGQLQAMDKGEDSDTQDDLAYDEVDELHAARSPRAARPPCNPPACRRAGCARS